QLDPLVLELLRGLRPVLLDGVEHARDEHEELLVVRYRLRLAADADHCGDRLVDIDRNLALGRLTAGAFRSLGDSLLAQQLRGCLDVAVGLDQRLLAVHHSGAGQLAELLDLAGRDRGGHHAPPSATFAGSVSSTFAGSVAGSGAPASSSVGAASSLGRSAGA